MVLRNPPADVSAYVELLAAADVVELERGVTLALKNRTFFPVPSELFTDCELARPTRTWAPPITKPSEGETFTHHIPNPFGGKGITITVDRNWKYNCADCGDHGWLSMWCGGLAPKEHQFSAACGRRNDHTAHEWAQHCACWFSNPDVVARRERLAAAAVTRTAKQRAD